jgi:hypothetical protein
LIDLSAFRKGEIPAEYPDGDLSALPPKPEDSAPLPDRIAWEALDEVASFANWADPGASASCPDFDPATTPSVTCTVQFLGETYDYLVSNISFTPSGLRRGKEEHGYVRYQGDLIAGPIVRNFVESVMRHQLETEYTICDMGDHARIPFDEAHKRSSEAGSIVGESILVTGIECRGLDVATGKITTVDLELYEWGSPIHLDHPLPGAERPRTGG